MKSNYFKFIFIDICKTAGTSINRSFLANFPDVDFEGYHHSIPNMVSGEDCGAVCSYITQEDIELNSLFTVVRNPYDRLVSLYFWGKNNEYSECNTFKDFVINVINNKYTEYNQHRYKSQVHWISDINGKIVVDNILRFENLETDFEELLKKLKIPNFKLIKTNTAYQRSGIVRKHYSYYYDEETKNMVTEFYKDDLEAFNYCFENNNDNM